MIQEVGPSARSIESKIEELANLPELTLSADEVEEIRRIGDNTGCMDLKGGNPRHIGEPLPDRWSLTSDLSQVAERWQINPARDLAYAHAESAAAPAAS
jgi:hypothetical protein